MPIHSNQPAEDRKPSSKGLDGLAGEPSGEEQDDDTPFDEAGEEDPGENSGDDDPDSAGEGLFANEAEAKKWVAQQQKVVEAMENAQGIDEFLGMDSVAAKLDYIEATYPELHQSFQKALNKHRKML